MAEKLKLLRRTVVGKSAVRKLRSEGIVPGIVYGRGEESTPVQVEEKVLDKYLEHGGRVADLQLEGRDLKAVVKEVQHDIFEDNILHIDFQLVSVTEKIVLPVPIVLKGELPFPPDQGILEQLLNEAEVECLPQDAPEEITISVSELNVGDSIHVSDISLPQGVTMVTPGEEAVATVRRPAIEEEEAPTEEEEAEEPEVIGEKKEEEAAE
jgi:large subunit ribosomal protein L25